ncbi:MAG: triose-phosphate isomerase [Bacteriovoracaceae bacterium]|jgi:triosephosphate isomerase|nr:triose-phosphate isomerase [Bacteriovoracaceae bacterium]
MSAKLYMIGNWKMNQNKSEIKAFFDAFNNEGINGNFGIAPQAIHLSDVASLSKSNFVCAQNINENNNGAFTGELSPASLKEYNVTHTLIGHSERRSIYGETCELINKKVHAALDNEITPILCIGETLAQREAGKTLDIVLGQITDGLNNVNINSSDDIILAYEPVWAIGTGVTATPQQADEVHNEIRKKLETMYPEHGSDISILYGGSVKPANVVDLLAKENVNGGLVGGASLKADSFKALCIATI